MEIRTERRFAANEITGDRSWLYVCGWQFFYEGFQAGFSCVSENEKAPSVMNSAQIQLFYLTFMEVYWKYLSYPDQPAR